MRPIGRGDWRTAADRLAALAADVPDSPAVWRNLATLRGWLADNAGCIDALRKYAALRAGEQDGLEDAVEAEATAMFLSDDPLGDRIEMFKVVWTVKDVERLQEALLSSPRWQAIPFDPARLSDGENPPPKGAYMLLDRPRAGIGRGIEPGDDAQRARPGPVVRAADRPRGPAGSDERGGRRTGGGRPDGPRVGPGGRRAGTEAGGDRPLVGQSEIAADGLVSAARRLGRSGRCDGRAARARGDSGPLAGVETGGSRRPLAARGRGRRESAALGCWRRSWCSNTGPSGCPAKSTSTNCARGSACRRSGRSSRPADCRRGCR